MRYEPVTHRGRRTMLLRQRIMGHGERPESAYLGAVARLTKTAPRGYLPHFTLAEWATLTEGFVHTEPSTPEGPGASASLPQGLQRENRVAEGIYVVESHPEESKCGSRRWGVLLETVADRANDILHVGRRPAERARDLDLDNLGFARAHREDV